MEYPPSKLRDKMYDQAFAFLYNSERKIMQMNEGATDPSIVIGIKVPITPTDVTFLIEELYRGRSIITGLFTRLVLVRWRAPTGETLQRIGEENDEQKWASVRLRDIVCMTKEEATRHHDTILKGGKQLKELYDEETIERVEARLVEARACERFRV
jgi:hypothetical protein